MNKVHFIGILFCIAMIAAVAHAGSTTGKVYFDANASARSHYLQNTDEQDVGVGDIAVSLLGEDGLKDVQTNSDGDYSFHDLSEGTYFTEVELPRDIHCSSHNIPKRVPAAIREGELTILAIGDSLGKIGSEKPYPEWLGEHFDAVTDTTVINLHVPGSRSWEWMPGDEKAYWEDRVLPNIENSDLVVMSIGGNDADIYVEGMGSGNWDFGVMLQRFFEHPEYLLLILPRGEELLGLIHEENPEADVLYFVYPNYANSCFTRPILGMFYPIAHMILSNYIEKQRDQYQTLDWLLLADMYQFWYETELDDFLFDEIHYNDLGHEIIGRAMFETLGGVIIDSESPDDSRLFGLDDFYCDGCRIGSECIAHGTLNPDEPCQICNTTLNSEGWSTNEGTGCDDGLFCNGGDFCHAGSCSRHEGNPCFDEQVCDEESAACLDQTEDDDDELSDDDSESFAETSDDDDDDAGCCG